MYNTVCSHLAPLRELDVLTKQTYCWKLLHWVTQETHETVNYQPGQITAGRVMIIAPHSHASITCHVLDEA